MPSSHLDPFGPQTGTYRPPPGVMTGREASASIGHSTTPDVTAPHVGVHKWGGGGFNLYLTHRWYVENENLWGGGDKLTGTKESVSALRIWDISKSYISITVIFDIFLLNK